MVPSVLNAERLGSGFNLDASFLAAHDCQAAGRIVPCARGDLSHMPELAAFIACVLRLPWFLFASLNHTCGAVHSLCVYHRRREGCTLHGARERCPALHRASRNTLAAPPERQTKAVHRCAKQERPQTQLSQLEVGGRVRKSSPPMRQTRQRAVKRNAPSKNALNHSSASLRCVVVPSEVTCRPPPGSLSPMTARASPFQTHPLAAGRSSAGA